ncbi:hypothetical protein JXA32_17785 [Candidatus Sumerlaeota bacterium]|nr:hypothetical protein [Candidatus Sumerlaeota bacterium]
MLSLKERTAFLKEMLRDSYHTGSVTPSSRFLANEMARQVKQARNGNGQPYRVLEAGPGTGPITKQLIMSLRAGDELVAYELNQRLAEHLMKSLGPLAEERQVRFEVVNEPVQNVLQRNIAFDAVVSGLPINNFAPALVDELFDAMLQTLKPDCPLCFYTYMGMRKFKKGVTFGEKRNRIAAVDRIVKQRMRDLNGRTKNIFVNMPPAVVHTMFRNGKS